MGTRKVPICTKMQKEKYFLRKERLLIYLLFNELGTNHLAFPIKTVQIL